MRDLLLATCTSLYPTPASKTKHLFPFNPPLLTTPLRCSLARSSAPASSLCTRVFCYFIEQEHASIPRSYKLLQALVALHTQQALAHVHALINPHDQVQSEEMPKF